MRLAGADKPKGPDYDGEDVLDTLLGASSESRETPLYFARPPDRKEFYEMTDLPDLAVRDGKWKLLADYDGGSPRLYDIVNDPGEAENLADAHPEVTADLVEQLTRWYQSLSR